MTIREYLKQLQQIEIEYEDKLDDELKIDFDSNDNEYFELKGVEITRSLGTLDFTLRVIEA